VTSTTFFIHVFFFYIVEFRYTHLRLVALYYRSLHDSFHWTFYDVNPFLYFQVLVQIMKRRKRLNSLPPLARAWLKFRAVLFMSGSSSSLRATEQLHVMLVGRRFSSRLSPMVFNSDNKCFELEVWDQNSEEAGAKKESGRTSPGKRSRSDVNPRIVEVLPRELGAHIKQAPWEQQWWNEEEENKLVCFMQMCAHLECSHHFTFLLRV